MEKFAKYNTVAKQNGTILDVVYEIGDKKYVQFVGLSPLEPIDFRILKGLVSLLQKNGIQIELSAKKTLKERLASFLEADFVKCFQGEMILRTTIDKLLAEIRLESTEQCADDGDVRASIYRMSNFNVSGRRNTGRLNIKLISGGIVDESTRELSVAINPFVAKIFI